MAAAPTTRIRFLRPFTTKIFNRLSIHFAGWAPMFAILSHVGRRSGRTYRTPINVFRRGEHYVFALTYGSDVQWLKNIMAAGDCMMRTRGHDVHLVEPELIVDPELRLMPLPVRLIGRFNRVTEFLRMREERGSSTSPERRLPRWVPWFNILARRLLAAGVPMGPDYLLTVQGRRTGLARSTPVTVCESGGRRGLISPFGETQWVRNLRAAGRATISIGGRREEVSAVELKGADAAGFVRDVVAPHARRSRLGDWFVRTVDRIDLDHPEEAVIGMPIFEIYPARGDVGVAGASGAGVSGVADEAPGPTNSH
jgi:deazaflavin-dependent oxidoreductase (nitroreductase family)